MQLFILLPLTLTLTRDVQGSVGKVWKKESRRKKKNVLAGAGAQPGISRVVGESE